MVMSEERIKQAMKNIFLYLEGPKFENTYAGAEYCICKLALKKITAIPYRYDYDDAANTLSEALSWGVSFEYHGWKIHIEEEMFAERISDGRVVYCPPC